MKQFLVNKPTKLMEAVRERSLPRVIEFARLEHFGAQLKPEQHKSALMMAVELDFPQAVPYLLQEAGLQTESGHTALQLALALGNGPVAQQLVQAEQETSKLTPLMLCAFLGNEDRVRQILQESKEQLRRADSLGRTALIYAALGGQGKTARLLAPIEARMLDAQQKTALMHAAQRDNAECVAILLANEGGMVEGPQKQFALHTAVLHRSSAAVRELRHVESNLKTLAGWTALMAAAEAGNAEMVGLLAEFELGQVNESGLTALAISAANNHESCMELLRAEAGLVVKPGRSALVAARDTGAKNALKWFERNQTELQREQDALKATKSSYVLQLLQSNIAQLIAEKKQELCRERLKKEQRELQLQKEAEVAAAKKREAENAVNAVVQAFRDGSELSRQQIQLLVDTIAQQRADLGALAKKQ